MAKKLPPLGRAQLEALRAVNPQLIVHSPDARTLRALESLERRGLCSRIDGHWVITAAGIQALAAIDGPGPS